MGAQGGTRRPFKQLFRLCIYLTLGVGLFLFDPFRIGKVAEEYSEDIADILVFGPQYGRGAQDEVSVVLITERSLGQLETTWPIPLEVHARLLSSLLRYEPDVVFVDILFLDERDGDELESFFAMLRKYEANGGSDRVPIFFAGPAVRDAQIRADLRQYVNTIPLPVLEEGREAREYPIRNGSTDELTPAFKMFKELRPELASEVGGPEPIRVVWGTTPHPINQSWMTECVDIPDGLIERAWSGFLDLESIRQRCPHAGFIPAEVLPNIVIDEDIQRLVQGNAVFVGAAVHAANDMVSVASYGDVPGVFFHAMALDNLLAGDGDYRRSSLYVGDLTLGFVDSLTREDIDLILAVVMIGLLVRFLPHTDRLKDDFWRVGEITIRKNRVEIFLFVVLLSLGAFVVQILLAAGLNLTAGNWLSLWVLIGILGSLASWRPASLAIAAGTKFRNLFRKPGGGN